MLAYILGITKRGNKGITNLDRFYGLQIRTPIKWSKTMLDAFESRVTKNQRNAIKLVLCLCQLFPQPWDNFELHRAFVQAHQKK